MSDSFQKKILVFLVADMMLSVSLLLIAQRAHAGRETSSVPQAVEEKQETSQVTVSQTIEESAAARQRHESDNRLASATKSRIKEEVSKQTESYEKINGTKSFISLEELKTVSPEAYEDLQRQLAHERKKSEAALTKRKQFLAELKPDILQPEDFVELKEALEFLNECDQNIIDGSPIQDRSADYDWKRIQRLRAITEKACCAMSGCTEDIVERKQRMESVTNSNRFCYKPVIPKELTKTKQ
jgi:hypothetical protein